MIFGYFHTEFIVSAGVHLFSRCDEQTMHRPLTVSGSSPFERRVKISSKWPKLRFQPKRHLAETLISWRQRRDIWKINFHFNQGHADLRRRSAHKSPAAVSRLRICLSGTLFIQCAAAFLHAKLHRSLADLCRPTLVFITPSIFHAAAIQRSAWHRVCLHDSFSNMFKECLKAVTTDVAASKSHGTIKPR